MAKELLYYNYFEGGNVEKIEERFPLTDIFNFEQHFNLKKYHNYKEIKDK